MTGAFTRSALHPFRAVLLAVCLVPGAGTLLLGTAGPAGATGTASVTISPAASGGQYQTGQTVSVTVGPNSLFAPNTRVVILECADPGGSVADLPTGFIDCDGNTIQGDTVMVQANGSFAESSYTIYALPNRALGESSTNIPVCSATQPCVLFVGEDQNDFTQPKVFSKPFTVSGAGLTTPAGSSGSSGQSSAAGGSSAGPAAGGTSDVGFDLRERGGHLAGGGRRGSQPPRRVPGLHRDAGLDPAPGRPRGAAGPGGLRRGCPGQEGTGVTAVLTPPVGTPPVDDVPIRINRTGTRFDKLFRFGLGTSAALVLAILASVVVFLTAYGWQALKIAGIRFFTDSSWSPDTGHFGASLVAARLDRHRRGRRWPSPDPSPWPRP